MYYVPTQRTGDRACIHWLALVYAMYMSKRKQGEDHRVSETSQEDGADISYVVLCFHEQISPFTNTNQLHHVLGRTYT